MEESKIISPRTAIGIAVCVSASAAFALLGFAYAALIGGDKLFGAIAGAVIAVPIAVFEVFVVQARVGEPLRRLPLWAMTAISMSIWILSIAAGILIITPVIVPDELLSDWDRIQYLSDKFLQDLIFCLVVALLINFSIRIYSLVGARVLLNFLLGRYHRPLREQQVFMFVDFIDARGMSSRLGDLRAQSLISAVFFDIDGPVVANGGETHRYIADELVVTWPLQRGIRDARCLKCALEIAEVVRMKSERYRKHFGEAPRLRIALHGGPVVVSEIGDDRREIVYFGDTINTTARLRGLAKKIQRQLVISAELLGQMRLPDGADAEDMGSFALSGKADETRVFAVHADDGHPAPAAT